MKLYRLLIFVVILTTFSCKKEDSNSSKIVITGQFQKMVQGTNIWVETIEGVTAEEPRHVMFVPENIENTLEEMYSIPDEDGNFQVTLNKGETYHVIINYYNRASAEGVIKFNETLYNKIIVPTDAPNSADLGNLYITAWYPYGSGGINNYLAEKPLPWLTESIDITDNTAPNILATYVSTSIIDDPLSEYGHEKRTYEAGSNDADGDVVYYNWFLTTNDNSASFLAWNSVIRTVGNEVSIYTKSGASHGTLTLIITDEKGGSDKMQYTF
jgi:hypothetical protein